MKNLIMFFVLVMVMVFSNYEISYSQEDDGIFLFLIGNEGNEKAIMYLHIEGERAYGSYYTESQSITYGVQSGFNGSFDGKNLKLSYHDDNWKERTITGTLSSDIVFSGKHNSKNVNLSLANAPVNSARIEEDKDNLFYGKKFIFNVRALNNLDYFGGLEEIAYLDENIIIFNSSESSSSTRSHTYSINTGREIEMKDFISNLNDRNLLALLRKKDASNYSVEKHSFDDYSFDEYSFCITPKGITFYINKFYRYHSDDGPEIGLIALYIDCTFEELKPYIKRGSPLDYLFN